MGVYLYVWFGDTYEISKGEAKDRLFPADFIDLPFKTACRDDVLQGIQQSSVCGF